VVTRFDGTTRGPRGLARLTAAAALLLLPLLTAPAAVAESVCADDDRDVFAGAPRYSGSRGAVDVHQAGRAPQVLTRSSLHAGAATAGDEFGASVAHERSGTGCALLVIGAPGVNHGRGAVYVAVDSATGFAHGPAALVVAPPGTGADRFGERVLLSRSVTDGPDTFDLWVGAPRRDVGSATDAGAIERYRLTRTPGTDGVAVMHVQTLRQGTTAVPGTTAEVGDRFGEVLAGAERGIVVGVPHEDVGTRIDAGMVTMIGWSAGTYRGLRNLTQNTAGVAGTAESGDRFGAALTDCANVIGAPGEDLGRLADAGMVQVLNGCDPRHLSPARGLTQNSPGVPGADEAGDRLGAAVALTFSAEDGTSVFIGIPGEDLGSVRDAGAVVGEYACGVPPCGWRGFTQGEDLAGAAEAGDRLGSSLALRDFYRVDEGGSVVHETSFPLAGAPGEDLGAVRDAGAAYGRALNGSGGVDLTSVKFSAGPRTGLGFGTVIATDTYGYPDA
jgi:hypothetical protein